MSEEVGGIARGGLTVGIGALIGSIASVALMDNLQLAFPEWFEYSMGVQFRFWALGLILIAMSMTIVVGFIGGLFISAGSVIFAYDTIAISWDWLSTLMNILIVIVVILVCVFLARQKVYRL